MTKVWLLILAFLIAFSMPVLAVTEPGMISKMRFEVEQSATILLEGNPSTLDIELAMPQEDGFQKIESIQASLPYTNGTDDYGNRILKFSLNYPGSKATLNVKTVVSTSRRDTAALPQLKFTSRPTGLAESGDSGIISAAEEAAKGESKDFERAAAVAKWVNENIRYDTAYAGLNISAKKTLQAKAGVCSGYAVLTTAMLRSIGYKAAYVSGYAYNSSGEMEPHGWVEACGPGGSCYPLDPTWAEAGWLDAAHLKFASLPDDHFGEAYASSLGYGRQDMELDENTKIKVLSSAEEPKFTTETALLDETLWDGYAVLKTDVKTEGCAMTEITFTGCAAEDGAAVIPEKNRSIAYFCDKGTVFMPFRISEGLDKGSIYACPLTASPSGGDESKTTLTLNPDESGAKKVSLSLDRTAIKPGETIEASAANADIFTDSGLQGRDRLSITATKSFRAYAYKDGQLDFRDVTVSESRPLDAGITAPESANEGEAINVTVGITNLDTKARDVTVRIGNETRAETLGPGESRTLLFTPTPSADDSIVQAFITSGDFSTSTSSPITIIKPKSNILGQVFEAIMKFVTKLLGISAKP